MVQIFYGSPPELATILGPERKILSVYSDKNILIIKWTHQSNLHSQRGDKKNAKNLTPVHDKEDNNNEVRMLTNDDDSLI